MNTSPPPVSYTHLGEALFHVDVLDHHVHQEGLHHQAHDGVEPGLNVEDKEGREGDDRVAEQEGLADVQPGELAHDHGQDVGAPRARCV